MTAKSKYYVVWEGLKPGIYDTWEKCKQQVEGVTNASYKSFDTIEEACEAYTQKAIADAIAGRVNTQKEEKSLSSVSTPKPIYHDTKGCPLSPPDYRHDTVLPLPMEVVADALAVDAACSGNPGPMEYRCIHLATGQQIFHIGPLYGTNNIGEFLAIVHALALLKKRGRTLTIYSDSRNALSWVRRKKCKTTLPRNAKTQKVYEMIDRAEAWLSSNDISTIPLLKWETSKWGEIPADFGRK